MTAQAGNKPTEPAPVKYVPKRKIRAVGSYYSVYEATQVGLDRLVELRVLNVKLKAGSPELARFQHEFATLGSLDHPNIIRVLDLGVMADHVFYVTDLRNAKSFQELMDKGREFDFSEAISVVRQILGAIAHLHRKKVVHRDISSATVYLDQDNGIPYIAEFSVMKNQNVQGPSLTQRGIPTLKTLAKTPEAIKAMPYDQRTDLYHAGGFLYRLLTNQEPPLSFAGPGEIADMCHPRSVNPRVPVELDAVVVKALRASPDERFQTAEEFQHELDRVSDKLELKTMLSEMVETTLTDNQLVRPIKPKNDKAIQTLEMHRDDFAAMTKKEGKEAATSTMVMDKGSIPSRKKKAEVVDKPFDPAEWIRERKEYLYLMGGPMVVVLVIAVLMSTHDDRDMPGVKAAEAKKKRQEQLKAEAHDYEPDVRKACEMLKGSPCTKDNFHQRWYLLDNWIKQLAGDQKKTPFSAADLVSIRINFYRDEGEAAGKLDTLYEKAYKFLLNPPDPAPRKK